MANEYRDYQVSLAPPWLKAITVTADAPAWGAFDWGEANWGPTGTFDGERWLKAFGTIKDGTVRRAVEATRARFAETAPEDGLELLGNERGLPRYPGETLDGYRARVVDAFEFWSLSGTVTGITRALTALGHSATVEEHFKTDKSIWAEFSVDVTPLAPPPADALKWDGGTTWDSGAVWPVIPGQVEFGRLREFLNEYKAAHSRLRVVRYHPYNATPQPRWDDGTVWDDAGKAWATDDSFEI